MENKKLELDIVIFSEGKGKNRVYSISSVQVPNVVTQGKSIDEAKKRLKEALELYFESMPIEKQKLIEFSREDDEAPMMSRIFL